MLSILRTARPVARALSRRRPARHALRPRFDHLDDRVMLTASGGFTIGVPQAIAGAPFPASVVEFSADPSSDPGDETHFATPTYQVIPSDGTADPLSTSPNGFTPSQVARAYGFDQIALPGGVKADGTGQTIVIVDAYNNPNIVNDLSQFDTAFGLPAPPSFTVYKQTVNGVSPVNNSGWAGEIALDVEWAHAMAPGANIILAEAYDNSYTNLYATATAMAARPGVSVLSMSFGSNEYFTETGSGGDNVFVTPSGHAGITFIASSGDDGVISYPASSPRVLGVGGTTLTTDSSGNYLGEQTWGGSGGGTSVYEARPSYQNGVVSSSFRQSPDVAYDANPLSGFAVYDSTNYGTTSPWVRVGGTSAGSPQWASLIAIADQARALNGLSSLDGYSQTLPMLYKLPSSDFHDITTGNSNGSGSPTVGYDVVTGLGSPKANLIVSGLAGSSQTTSSGAIVNDGQPGYAQAGGWVALTGLGYNNNLRYRSGTSADAASSSATWTATNLAAGTYDVQADWNGYGSHAPDARYTIYVNGVAVGTYTVDQRVDSAGGPAAGSLAFQTIASVAVPSGATIALVLSGAGGGDVVADAARFAVSTPPTVSSATQVIDDGQPGYAQAGGWVALTGLGYNNNLRYRSGTSADAASSSATWTATNLAAGTYDVQADWNGYGSHAPDARYTIYVNGVAVGTYTVDQRVDSAGGPAAGSLAFQTIASVAVPSGATIALVLSGAGGGDVVADAARFAVSTPPTVSSATQVIDDGQPGYAQAGGWVALTGLGYNNNLRYRSGTSADAASSSATWTATNLAAGTYDVQADWNGYGSHAPDARYTIYVNGVAVGTYTVDQRVDSAGGPAAGSLAFQTIASVAVPSGATIALVLSGAGGGDVVADAARFAVTGT